MAVIFDSPNRVGSSGDQVLRLTIDEEGDLVIKDLTEGDRFFVYAENIQALAETVTAIAAELKKETPDNG